MENLLFQQKYIEQKENCVNKLSGIKSPSNLIFENINQNNLRSMTSLNFDLSEELSHKIISLCSSSKLSIFLYFQSVLKCLLGKMLSQDDILICSPIFLPTKTDETINELVYIRSSVDPEKTFKELLLSVKDDTVEMYENQDYPSNEIVKYLSEIEKTDSNVFHNCICCSFDEIHILTEEIKATKDLFFDIIDDGGIISFRIYYNKNRYKDYYIHNLISYFNSLNNQIINNINKPLKDYTLNISDQDIALLERLNNTKVSKKGINSIIELFEQQAQKNPNNVVLVDGKTTLTFQELNYKSDILAAELLSNSVESGSIVGILMNPGYEYIISILGILKIGATFLPLEHDLPNERLEFILSDSNALCYITHEDKNELINGNALIYETLINSNSNKPVGFKRTSKIDTDDIVYIIYTSGTTGYPKGVLIKNRNIVNYSNWFINENNIEQNDKGIVTSSFSFDAPYTQIFSALITGGELHVIKRDVLMNPEILIHYINENKISYLKLTPSLFKLIAQQLRDDSVCLENLRLLILGGEQIDVNDIIKTKANFKDKIKIINHYGPTETTIGSIFCTIENDGIEEYKINPIIGKPINNTFVHVVDHNKRLLPSGVKGELAISGEGVAAGYLNRPELTHEKFIRDSLDRGSIKYLTGDLAKYLENENILLFGRIDNQVKLRGYRIELEEIEKKLKEMNDIQDALVVLRTFDNQNSICAYYVSEQQITREMIIEALNVSLPNYMIPADFVQLEKIPLTIHNKVDYSSLPQSGDEINTLPSGESRNELEQIMIEVLEEVLRKKNIKITDSFFMIGGDSIKAIQFTSKLNRMGYKLEMKDLFTYPRIWDLSSYVTPNQTIDEQKTIIGDIPLIPIQKYFFEKQGTDFNHYNQSIYFIFKERINFEHVRKVFDKIIEHHDALRINFKIKDNTIKQFNNPYPYPYPLSINEYDFHTDDNVEEKILEIANKEQQSINIEQGPLMRLNLFHCKNEDKLLMIFHHLVIDGVSWRILMEDFNDLHQQIVQGNETLQLPNKTMSYKLWAEKLEKISQNENYINNEFKYWKDMQLNAIDYSLICNSSEPVGIENIANITVELDEQSTNTILTNANIPFNTETNELIISALVLALNKTFNIERIPIFFEGHGREELFHEVDISRTIGWFTTIYPIILELASTDYEKLIVSVKDSIRKISYGGISFGILKYLVDDNNIRDYLESCIPQISYNYLGQFDSDIQDKEFAVSSANTGNTMSSNSKVNIPLNIVCLISNEKLRISFSFAKNKIETNDIQTLGKEFVSSLKHLAKFCSETDSRSTTSSDFSYKEFTSEELDSLFD
jgi:amino acid adenylation domain-containing protein/non-ribosomal peptide synthase protein (TIGR01720 family)